jgi:hypothetical protein
MQQKWSRSKIFSKKLEPRFAGRCSGLVLIAECRPEWSALFAIAGGAGRAARAGGAGEASGGPGGAGGAGSSVASVGVGGRRGRRGRSGRSGRRKRLRWAARAARAGLADDACGVGPRAATIGRRGSAVAVQGGVCDADVTRSIFCNGLMRAGAWTEYTGPSTGGAGGTQASFSRNEAARSDPSFRISKCMLESRDGLRAVYI